jgi:L-histidine N-alpha-methyltransferase
VLSAATLEIPLLDPTLEAVAEEARRGLTAPRKTLAPWLFYDDAGSRLFEQITALPEYYLTRAEREIFSTHAPEILALARGAGSSGPSDAGRCDLTIAELGAGTAAKTGILLRELVRDQPEAVYQPIDISASALAEARGTLERAVPGLRVRPCVANYVTDGFCIERPAETRVLALYIGSSIGNFTAEEACAVLRRLRAELQPGDALLLGTDLAPGATKPLATLLAAYDDAAGVTAAFNRNILVRLNRDLGADFDPERFVHRALWNPAQARIEMHLQSQTAQTVTLPARGGLPECTIRFARGETIHTENSCKFSLAAVAALLGAGGFHRVRTFMDAQRQFAVTLAAATGM